jgi:hypothetical protein
MASRNKKQKPSSPPPLEVKLPDPDKDQPSWARAGIFAGAGLLIGLVWPVLAGVRVGPDVPGAKKAEEPTPAETSLASSPAVSASASAPKLAQAAPALEGSNQQKVVVKGGEIDHCYHKRDRMKGAECGVLKVDRTLAPRLEQLAGCASALGLDGEMGLGFDIDFEKKVIKVIKGDKSELPSSTINGIIACTVDYIADVSPDKIPHKYSRYRVDYMLRFYPPGSAPAREGASDEAEDTADSSRGLGTVSWDTALVRSEPNTGTVVARLVRGTRVKLLGRRKDWYRVKVGVHDGWIYRAALGM